MWTYQIWPITNLEWAWVGLISIVLLSASYFDLKSRIIPNSLSFGGILCMELYLLFFSTTDTLEHFLGLIISLVVFFALYWLNAIGGGDSKLFMFVSLSFGAPYLISVWLWIFIIGGIQALFYALIFKQKNIPYALSITLGTLLYVLSSRFYA